ncbi:MAG: AAA family ATPase [Planctomycetota bacterium]
MQLADLETLSQRLKEQTQRVVVGQDRPFELMLVALLAEGHVLLEGVPGMAKTLLARAFAAGLSLKFSRIQFTPDLMPADVIGTNLFNFSTNQFVLTKGPIFTQVLLADEINRTPPKTQAALLEAMQERSVTLDSATHPLGSGFMVIATQNPIEHEGTYPLPEAQLDRFLFKIRMQYPTRDEELTMVRVHGQRTSMPNLADFALAEIADVALLETARRMISSLTLAPEMEAYIVDLVRATREHPALLCGASPRAASMLACAARTYAALKGRNYVIPDDVKALLEPVLAHRLVLAPGAEIDGTTANAVLTQVAEQLAAPR